MKTNIGRGNRGGCKRYTVTKWGGGAGLGKGKIGRTIVLDVERRTAWGGTGAGAYQTRGAGAMEASAKGGKVGGVGISHKEGGKWGEERSREREKTTNAMVGNGTEWGERNAERREQRHIRNGEENGK
ncbi:hypothetical protein Tco_0793731 [Tanacetum coccineum]